MSERFNLSPAPMSDRDYAVSQLLSAHRWMDRVYAAHIATDGALTSAYESAVRRLANAERRALSHGVDPLTAVQWSSELQEWRAINSTEGN